MRTNDKFVEGCEALAESFESMGRVDLASLCDRAAYWLDGGNGVDLMSIQELVGSCHDTLRETFKTNGSMEDFIAKTSDEIRSNIKEIEAAVVVASKNETNPEVLIDRAAKLQALSILASGLFK